MPTQLIKRELPSAANGGIIATFRGSIKNGATPLDNMVLGMNFEAPNETAGLTSEYGRLELVLSDVTAGSEDASFRFRAPVAGVMTTLGTFNSAGFQYPDNRALLFGDGSDVSVVWDASNLVITPAVDDTGSVRFGNGTLDMDVRMTLGAAGDYVELDVGDKALQVVGDVRVDFSAATIAAGNTDGGLIKAGTSGAPVVEDTANMKFVSMYFDDGANAGAAEGVYIRLFATGTLDTAQVLRAFTSVTDVAVANARGAHISLSFGTTGRITGLGAAVDATLHIPSTALPAVGGNYAVFSGEINSDAASADPTNAEFLSLFRLALQGTDGGAFARIDPKAYLINFVGFSSAAGVTNMISSTSLAELPASSIGFRVRFNGADYYIPAVIAAQWN